MIQEVATKVAGDSNVYSLLASLAHLATLLGVIGSLYFTLRAQRRQEERRNEDVRQEQARWEDQARREKRRDRLYVAQLKRERLVGNYPKWATAMGAYVVQRGAFLVNQERDEEMRRLILSGTAGENAKQASDYYAAKAERHKTLEQEASQRMQAAALAIRWDDGPAFADEVQEVTHNVLAWHQTGQVEGGAEIGSKAHQVVEDRLWTLRKAKS